MEPKWTTKQTAAFLGITAGTLEHWRWRGVGPPFQKLNGAVRYDPQAVRDWAAEQTRTSTTGSDA